LRIENSSKKFRKNRINMHGSRLKNWVPLFIISRITNAFVKTLKVINLRSFMIQLGNDRSLNIMSETKSVMTVFPTPME
jgi:hypothetical protein